MLVTGDLTWPLAWITFTRKASTALRPMSSRYTLEIKTWKYGNTEDSSHDDLLNCSRKFLISIYLSFVVIAKQSPDHGERGRFPRSLTMTQRQISDLSTQLLQLLKQWHWSLQPDTGRHSHKVLWCIDELTVGFGSGPAVGVSISHFTITHT